VWKIDISPLVKDAGTAVVEKVIIPIKRSHVEGRNIGSRRGRIGDRLVVTVVTFTGHFLWLPFGPFTHIVIGYFLILYNPVIAKCPLLRHGRKSR